MADTDWGNVGWGLASAGTQYALGVDRATKANRAAKDKYDAYESSFNDQLKQFDKDYALELSGELTQQEKDNRDLLVNKTKAQIDQEVERGIANLTQQYSRAGMGGQELASVIEELRAAGAEKLANRATDIDATLLERASARATSVKGLRHQMLNSANGIKAQLDDGSAGIDYNSIGLQTLLPTVIGTAAGMSKGNNLETSFKQGGLESLLTYVGLDPAMVRTVPTKMDNAGNLILKTDSKGNQVVDEEATKRNAEIGVAIAAGKLQNKPLDELEAVKLAQSQYEKEKDTLGIAPDQVPAYVKELSKQLMGKPNRMSEFTDDYKDWSFGTSRGLKTNISYSYNKASKTVVGSDGSTRAATASEIAQYGK